MPVLDAIWMVSPCSSIICKYVIYEEVTYLKVCLMNEVRGISLIAMSLFFFF